MRRQVSRVNVSSMTDRRIDSTLLTRRAIRKALTSVRLLCHKFHRQNGKSDARSQSYDDEMWNLRNENLENELREMKLKATR